MIEKIREEIETINNTYCTKVIVNADKKVDCLEALICEQLYRKKIETYIYDFNFTIKNDLLNFEKNFHIKDPDKLSATLQAIKLTCKALEIKMQINSIVYKYKKCVMRNYNENMEKWNRYLEKLHKYKHIMIANRLENIYNRYYKCQTFLRTSLEDEIKESNKNLFRILEKKHKEIRKLREKIFDIIKQYQIEVTSQFSIGKDVVFSFS